MKSNRGFVLPVALLILAVLTVLSMGLSRMARNTLSDVQRRADMNAQEILYKSSTQKVLYHLLTGIPDVNKVVAGNVVLFVDNRAIKDGDLEIRIQDAAGLMGLMVYNQERFERLLEQLTDRETSQQLAGQLNDWIDADQLKSYQGMEVADYTRRSSQVLPRNAPLRTLDELLELPAMTESIYNGNENRQGLRDLLLAGGVEDFNIATAPDIMLGSMLGVSDKELQQLVELKKTGDWQNLRRLVASISTYYGTAGLEQGFQYRIDIKSASDDRGFKVRSLYKLTPSRATPYQQILWQYPDNDRG